VFVKVHKCAYIRAKEIQQLGIKTYDALHIACAEQVKADGFLSTDDRLIRAAKRSMEMINIEVENPLLWLQKVV
jgi:predicted nucleic acid-binding protein